MNTVELELDKRNREYLAVMAEFMPAPIVENWSELIGETRETATAGSLTIWARQSWFAHKVTGSNLTNYDVTPATQRTMKTEELKGLFFMSPSRHYVYMLAPKTEKGVKMLIVKAWIRGSQVVTFTPKGAK